MTSANRMLFGFRVVSIPQKILRFFGNADMSLFVSQLLYWLDRTGHPDGVHKTAEEWIAETGITYEKQKTVRRKLRELGFLTEKQDRWKHLTYYNLNMRKLEKAIDEWDDPVADDYEDGYSAPKKRQKQSRVMYEKIVDTARISVPVEQDEYEQENDPEEAEKPNESAQKRSSRPDGGKTSVVIHRVHTKNTNTPLTPQGGFSGDSAIATSRRVRRRIPVLSTKPKEDSEVPRRAAVPEDISDSIRKVAAGAAASAEARRLKSVSKTKQPGHGAKLTAKQISATWVEVMRKHHPGIPVASTAQSKADVAVLNNVLREALRVASLYEIFEFAVSAWREIRAERFSYMKKPMSESPKLSTLRGLWSYGFDEAFADRAARAERRAEQDAQAESETTRLRAENRRQAAELAKTRKDAEKFREKAAAEERRRIASERDVAAYKRAGRGKEKEVKSYEERMKALPDDLYDNVEIPEWGSEDE